MRAFIETNFKMIDINGDGLVSKPEFVFNCINRIAVDNVKVVEDAFDSLLSVSVTQSIFLEIFYLLSVCAYNRMMTDVVVALHCRVTKSFMLNIWATLTRNTRVFTCSDRSKPIKNIQTLNTHTYFHCITHTYTHKHTHLTKL